MDRLRTNSWWGQIVGPHGSGKSALLASLLPAIEEAGVPTLIWELHDGQRRPPAGWRQQLDSARAVMSPAGSRPAVLVVDGYEQLARWFRFRLKWCCRRRGNGLVVTAHDSVGLPDLCSTAPTVELAQQIVIRLQAGFPPHVHSDDVTELFQRCAGDLREMLFGLYDRYEERRRASGGSSSTLPH
jgi:hypothetical protein